MRRMALIQMLLVLFLCPGLTGRPDLGAQETKEEGGAGAPSFRPEELDQMLAPIALYPDPLLAQLLAASTYPLEIVQAARFLQQKKDLKGEALLAAAKEKEWDPSVKAMLQFPDVLLMMNDQIEWTEKVGNAFLSKQKEVMASIQRLRNKANDAGNLKSTKEQKIVVEKETKVIVIEPSSPQVVYVPAYQPAVYGVWAYPAYPPYPVYPPGYVVGAAAFTFAAGVAVGAAWHSWGCGWGHNEVTINTNNYNNFTKNNYTNAQKYQKAQNAKSQQWQHNPEHRKGAPYRDQATAQKFGQQRSGAAARPAASEARGYGGAGERGGGRTQTAEPSRGGGQQSAFSGSDRAGNERASSFRGQESRISANRSTGGSTGSGGASRGGGGRGGGRR